MSLYWIELENDIGKKRKSQDSLLCKRNPSRMVELLNVSTGIVLFHKRDCTTGLHFRVGVHPCCLFWLNGA